MKTIHIVGDSISIQYGPYLAQYLGSCCEYSRKEGRIGNLDIPEGANGGDSAMVLDYLYQCAAKKLHWDLLMINCGLHDIKRYGGRKQIDSIEYESNLRKIFEQGQALSHRLIWVRTTPVIDEIHNTRIKEFERYNEDVEEYNKIADGIATEVGVRVVNLNRFSRSLGGVEIYQDHVHFTAEVQKLQGAFIVGHIDAVAGTGEMG